MRDEDAAFFMVSILAVCLFVSTPAIAEATTGPVLQVFDGVFHYLLESADRFVGSRIYYIG